MPASAEEFALKLSSHPKGMRLTIAAAVACTAAALLAACASSADPGRHGDPLVLAGSVHDDVVYVAAPGIAAPTVDLQAGITPSRLPPPPGLRSEALGSTTTAAARAQKQQQRAASGASVANASTTKPRVAGRIAIMYVALGSSVRKGAPVARLDDRLLVLGVKKAEADAAKARADIDVLSAKIDDLYDKRDELYTARDKVLAALAKIAQGERQLAAAQAKVDAGLAQITSNRSQVGGGIAQIEAQIAQIEKLPPDKRPPGLLAKLKAKLDGLLAAGKKLSGAYAQAKAGQAKLDAGKAQLAAGRTTAHAALHKIRDGIAQINDAIDKLKKARTLAIAALPTRDRAVVTARDRLAQATVLAPESGRVIQAMQPGEILMVGAPVVKIRPDGPSRIDTYLTIAQLPLAKVGTRVRVTADSTPDERFAATVTHVLPEYAFPPSALPTTEVHLLRTVPVTIVLAEGKRLPSGTPVDVSFDTTGSVTP